MTCTSADNAFFLVRLHDFIACSLTPPPLKSYFHTKRHIKSTFPLPYPFRMYVSAIYSTVTPGPILSRGVTLLFPPPKKMFFFRFGSFKIFSCGGRARPHPALPPSHAAKIITLTPRHDPTRALFPSQRSPCLQTTRICR